MVLNDGFLLRPYAHFSRSAFNAPPQAMTWSNTALTDFSCWEAGLKTLIVFEVGKHGEQYLVAHGGDLDLGQHQAQLLDRACSARAAVADEAGRLIVPLAEQKIDRILERAGDAVIVFGRDEDVAVEMSRFWRPMLWCGAYCIVP